MIRIICDSSSDITQEEAKKLQIHVVPMHINFGNEEFQDGIDLTFDEFYNRMEASKELPITSQINSFAWEEAINLYPEDEILIITMSSKLSGTYNNAVLASEGKTNVRVIDSLNVTAGVRILVDRAIELRDQGYSIDEIVNTINEEKKNVCLLAVLDTLKNLRKGGRISAGAAIIGEILGIKPMIEIKDGLVNFIGKARGSKNGFKKLKELMIEYGGIDLAKEVILAYTGNDDAMLEKYLERAGSDLEGKAFTIQRVGATIGTHIGAGGIAIVFFRKTK